MHKFTMVHNYKNKKINRTSQQLLDGYLRLSIPKLVLPNLIFTPTIKNCRLVFLGCIGADALKTYGDNLCRLLQAKQFSCKGTNSVQY